VSSFFLFLSFHCFLLFSLFLVFVGFFLSLSLSVSCRRCLLFLSLSCRRCLLFLCLSCCRCLLYLPPSCRRCPLFFLPKKFSYFHFWQKSENSLFFVTQDCSWTGQEGEQCWKTLRWKMQVSWVPWTRVNTLYLSQDSFSFLMLTWCKMPKNDWMMSYGYLCYLEPG